MIVPQSRLSLAVGLVVLPFAVVARGGNAVVPTTNVEIRMPKEARMTKPALAGAISWLRRGNVTAECTETPALTPALSPRRGRNMRRDEASSGHDFSTASGVVSLLCGPISRRGCLRRRGEGVPGAPRLVFPSFWAFGFRASFVIRHLAFGFGIASFVIRHLAFGFVPA